jgi:hypothetical protein
MSHEAAGIGISRCSRRHVVVKRLDVAVQSLQQLEAVIPPPASVCQKHQGLQLGQALA